MFLAWTSSGDASETQQVWGVQAQEEIFKLCSTFTLFTQPNS